MGTGGKQMTIGQALKWGKNELAQAGIEESEYESAVLLSDVLERPRLDMLLDKHSEINEGQMRRFDAFIRRRAAHEPLQYIEGKTEFMGFPFYVSPDVLIPRADTEILCETALRLLPQNASVFDLGTGSGAIAVSLAALRRDLLVTAGDISPAAIEIAKRNAEKNGVKIEFVLGNCLEPVSQLRYDMIVSNPPYISEEERKTLSLEVLNEPELALFDGGDGLSFYRTITDAAQHVLAENGILLFEIGWKQAHAVGAMLEERIGTPFFVKDYGGNWRVAGAARQEKAIETLKKKSELVVHVGQIGLDTSSL